MKRGMKRKRSCSQAGLYIFMNYKSSVHCKTSKCEFQCPVQVCISNVSIQVCKPPGGDSFFSADVCKVT